MRENRDENFGNAPISTGIFLGNQADSGLRGASCPGGERAAHGNPGIQTSGEGLAKWQGVQTLIRLGLGPPIIL